MASLNDIVRRHTDLGSGEREHLRRLVGSWGPLADLCFADMLLFAPVNEEQGNKLVSLGQIRPTTAQTMYRDDQIGRFLSMEERPMVALAYREEKIVEEEVDLTNPELRAKVLAIPVRYHDRVIAVVTRETTNIGHRSLGDLELAYLNVFERLAQMISEGAFPFPFEDSVIEVSPRVGDGALVLDRMTAIVYSSPNAVSAFHRLGYHGSIAGRKLEDLGFRAETAQTLTSLKVPVVEEMERGDSVTILARVVPLLTEGEIDGALVLMRDVSELRSQERLLVSMDATIREIHHRVKNNLQTVSSLLRIQGRRVAAPEAKAAIAEADRRIGSIAIVHEMLSRGGGDDVLFGDVVRPILDMAEAAGEAPVRIRLVGEGPVVSTTTASSLAVVVNELVQNAVEHGFPTGSAGGTVSVELVYSSTELTIRVHDDGQGLPSGFDLDNQTGLGLTIINTLVKGELGGRLTVRPASLAQSGTVAELTVELAKP
ncbi:MAG: ATPase [Actinomycetia bacterium]|nr:ATPase [Actinomycetes bacterium]MCP4223462.1 ATPase [Actinomycetes bacterium]